MAKRLNGVLPQYMKKTSKGTSQGRNPITSTMNKNKRKSYKKYRVQDENQDNARSCTYRHIGLDSHVGHASPTPNPFHRTSYTRS